MNSENQSVSVQSSECGQVSGASSSQNAESSANVAPVKSFANISQTQGAVRKNKAPEKEVSPRESQAAMLTEQMSRIVNHHKCGYRVIILMRGAPGSGKSTLSKQIVDATVGPSENNYATHIFCADNYFNRRGKYFYDVTRIGEAHYWNNNRVGQSCTKGLSPVIVDNTNMKCWEMDSHIRSAVSYGYYIEIVEPQTPWAKKASQLARKNTHNVPYNKILTMLDNYENHHSTEYLMKRLNLRYVQPFAPPVIRDIPPHISFAITETAQEPAANIEAQQSEQTASSIKNVENYSKLEEKVLIQWENGEQWSETEIDEEPLPQKSVEAESKPPRKLQTKETSRTDSSNLYFNNKIIDVDSITDWRQISNAVPAWDHDVVHGTEVTKPVAVVKKSCGTMVERGDHNVNDPYFIVLNTRPRDINFSYVPPNEIKIPKTIMLDKSCMTSDNFDVDTPLSRCKNENNHFAEFRKMFSSIAEDVLRDIFDKCCGDVNWASEVLLDGIPSTALVNTHHETETQSESNEHKCNEMCDCISNYDITPTTSVPAPPITVAKPSELPKVKKKKDKTVSESSAEMIRQLQNSVDIPDYHYSNHCLKIKKLRHGAVEDIISLTYCPKENSDAVTEATESSATPGPTVTQMSSSIQGPSSSTQGFTESQTETPPTSNSDPVTLSSNDEPQYSVDKEETLDVPLGTELIKLMIKVFEDKTDDVMYPDFIVPIVNMPKSFLNHMYAMWMESVAHQVDTHHLYTDILMKEDEELARKLAENEEESFETTPTESVTPPVPKEPDLREIMDLEVALSIAAKNALEWQSDERTDMAARLTKDKLCKLFPTIDKDVLAELLIAHHNNFNSTVEALLMSTGQADVLKAVNGVSKFVAEREAKLQQEAEDKARRELEEEWPVLGDGSGEQAEMEVATQYREKAANHLRERQVNQQKAQNYMSRGMRDAATHHAQLAEFHKQQSEHNNSLAAAAFVKVHATSKSSTTLDLHFLRVAEALQMLDLFLDHHIQLLGTAPSGRRHNSLFFVTGRGLHSPNGPRVKPAVKKRLYQRGLRCMEINPGLLAICVTDSNKLTHQVE